MTIPLDKLPLLLNKIKQLGIVFSKHEGECHFCDLKKSIIENDEPKNKGYDSSLYLCLRYDKDEKMFSCSVCNRSAQGSYEGRTSLLFHIKTNHQKAIELMGNNTKPKNECDSHVCREIYGLFNRKLWCDFCENLYMTTKKPPKPKFQEKDKLCPECGKSVTCLKTHINTAHSKQKHTCELCGKEFGSVFYLKQHNTRIHGEKVPCVHCGKLYGTIGLMNKHIHAQHTARDKMRYKCDHCGKGFSENQKLNDHVNIHTGEKPHKCKFCSACFASKGNHAQHEKSHLGQKRIYGKK